MSSRNNVARRVYSSARRLLGHTVQQVQSLGRWKEYKLGSAIHRECGQGVEERLLLEPTLHEVKYVVVPDLLVEAHVESVIIMPVVPERMRE